MERILLVFQEKGNYSYGSIVKLHEMAVNRIARKFSD